MLPATWKVNAGGPLSWHSRPAWATQEVPITQKINMKILKAENDSPVLVLLSEIYTNKISCVVFFHDSKQYVYFTSSSGLNFEMRLFVIIDEDLAFAQLCFTTSHSS